MSRENASHKREPIAIVGMGCRVPGAATPTELWNLLMAGGEAIREIPGDRFDMATLFDPTPATPGHISTKWAGVVEGIESFDAQFFGIAPREAELVDPQQRLLLEVSWEALEDAGIPAARVNGLDAGVFVGLFLSDYETRMLRDRSRINFYMTLGTGRYSASGRLSYFFGMRGPSMTVDTACSSSLVAINLACRSLWSGESNLALAGGANTILEPFITIAYSQSKMMAPDGRCKFGDAGANGYVRSDGAAMVALKRLSDAEADGDRIYAVILGGAVNNDGRGSGFLATPAQDGQEDLLRKAYRDAGVSPGHVQYVEAHGTGTLAGDPVEIGALGAVLSEGRPQGSPCRIGSVKTNVGHTEGAAGVTGLIKVALALKHGLIPKSLHFKQPNPAIPWESLPVEIQSETTEWPKGRDGAIAGVSGFGISGTNAHMVLQAYQSAVQSEASDNRTHILVVSAQSADALRHAAQSWSALLKDSTAPGSFAEICFTAAARRTHHDHRLAVVSTSREQAAADLDAFVTGETSRNVVTGQRAGSARKVALIFPGQGSQWLGMARGLLRDQPVFAEALQRCDAAVRALNGWSVLDELNGDESSSRLTQIDVVQPVLFSVQVALAALWRSWGIEPATVVGHSMGEIAAAHVAGALSLDDAARIICRRSTLLRRTSGKGAMAVVELSLADAKSALKGFESKLSVAVSNSPRSTVISGDPGALDQLLAGLEAREVFCRRVKVDVASHSPQMDPLRADLQAALEGLSPRSATIAFHSTVLARQLDGRDLNPEYWVNNLREPVLFANVIQQLIADGHNTFIEMSPHPLLVGAIQEMLQDAAGSDGLSLPSLRREEDEPSIIRTTLATLHVAGAEIPWERQFQARYAPVTAPLYPWQRERFWWENPATTGRGQSSDLLGEPFRPARQDHTLYWEFNLGLDGVPSLADHRVRGATVVPAALFLELALEAAARTLGSQTVTLDRVALSAALVLPASGSRTVQIVFSIDGPEIASFRVLSRKEESDTAKGWVEHVSGAARIGAATSRDNSIPSIDQAQLGEPVESRTHYANMDARGLQYGAAYQQLKRAWRAPGLMLAQVGRPAPPAGVASALQARAAMLDGCFQALASAIPSAQDGLGRGDTYVPTGLTSLRLHARPAGDEVWCYVRSSHSDARHADSDTFEGDLIITDSNGVVLLEAYGLQLFRLERERDTQLRSAFHRVEWAAAARAARDSSDAGRWLVIGANRASQMIVERLTRRGAGVTASRSPADTAAVLSTQTSLRGVIDTSMLASADPTDTAGLASAVANIQAIAAAERAAMPRLWFVTESAQSIDGVESVIGLAGGSAWGLRSVAAAEYPALRCSAIDLGAADESTIDALVDELLDDGGDEQVALRRSGRYVRRLRQGLPDRPASVASPASGRPYRVTTSSPGILDALTLEQTTRVFPSDHQVEIEVVAAGLNFMNVMSALGVYPGYPQGLGPLGIECVGRVSRVGRAVTSVAEGDRVMAFAFDSLATHALAHERLVRRIPEGLSFEQAATIPIAFLTAYYALHYVARVAAGDRVLIHSGAGGVGLAAIQLARAAGAQVLTTAGTEEKRAWLLQRGASYAGDSRSIAFADEIRELTGGAGVDIIVNSLSGDAIRAGLSILRAGGRFVELGKRDIYDDRAISLGAFRRGISYSAVDLDLLAREQPGVLGAIFDACMERFTSAGLQPLPTELFSVAEVASAFRRMAQGTHTGKIVVTINPTAAVMRRASVRPADWSTGAYLITGGTGGLGLEVARWMIEQGARDLVLVSRSGETTGDPRIEALRLTGARITVSRADVTQRDDVARVLREIEQRGTALRGVVHAAGLLDDATLAQLDGTKLLRPFIPKVLGAWHLHELTAALPLDFFVLFSSVAAFIGSAGQAAYGAANAWLDALASHRRANRLPAISINWGPWSDVGLAAARSDRGERLSASGLKTFGPALGLAAFSELLDRNPVHAAVMPFDIERWCESYPAARRWSLFTELLDSTAADAAPAAQAGLRDALLALPAGRRRRAHLESYLQQQVAQVLKLAAARVDTTKPLRTLGLDSLMALELRNRLEAATGTSVPATVIWNYPTIEVLAPQLAQRMSVALEEAGPASATEVADLEAGITAAELDDVLAEIEGMSEIDVRRLLADGR